MLNKILQRWPKKYDILKLMFDGFALGVLLENFGYRLIKNPALFLVGKVA